MAKRIGGLRRKTRSKLKKGLGMGGKIRIRDYLQEFKNGENVRLLMESAVHAGMYHPRFYGKTGVVEERVGDCYKVLIRDGGKEKRLIVHPVHLKRI